MNTGHTGNFWLLLEVLAKRRGFVIGFVLLVTIGAAAISLVLPSWYESNALLLPPKGSVTTMDQLSRLSEVVSVTGGLNLPIMVTPSDVYARMLKSRTLCDRIAEKYDLQQRYGTRTAFDTYQELLKHASFRVTEEGLVNVSVEDKEPQVAADMANSFVDEINSVSQEITSSRARQNRQFIEDRLRQARADLDSAHRILERFQQTNRAIDFSEQTKMALEQASQLKVSLAQIDLDIQINQRQLNTNHPEMQEKRERREIVKQQLDQLESGGRDSSYFALPVASIPSLKSKYEVLYGNVRIAETLHTMLMEQLEQAKIQEKQESPAISVLDRARVPEIKSRPQRTLIVGLTFGLSLVAAILIAALLEYLGNLRDQQPENYRRAQYALGAYLGWLPGMKSRNK